MVPDERLVNTSINCHPCKWVILDVQPNQAFRCPYPNEPSDHNWVKDQKWEPTNQAQSTHRPCNILVCSQSSCIAVSSHQISEWFVHNNKEGKGGKKAKKKKKSCWNVYQITYRGHTSHLQNLHHKREDLMEKCMFWKTFPDSVSFLHEPVNMGQFCILQTLSI